LPHSAAANPPSSDIPLPSAEPAQLFPPAPTRLRHAVYEDIHAIIAGTLLVSLGVALLGKAGLITGGTVGIAFLLHYLTGVSFGKLFFLINLPFYYLAVKKLGWVFTAKTFCAVALMSAFSEFMPLVFRVASIDPFYAAVMGGLLAGVGLLVLFRHKASLGGVNVLVLFLQERYGFSAGLIQLGLDAAILLLSTTRIPLALVGVSLLGAAVLNTTLAINHRPGRYMAI
jgi:uncharacterized membrane-anchored protein YitT (DUF2179 family)